MKNLRGIIHQMRRAGQQRAWSQYLSPVSRIEGVAPVPGRRLVAMTFDDGPTAGPCRPQSGSGSPLGLTASILDTLAKYHAHGTFDIIGTTADNYPDRAGRPGSFYWSGVKYDHYPEFGQDNLAGAVNQPDLVQRMLDEGHEISNHGYRHIAFGPPPLPYRHRKHLSGLESVIEDLRLLHDWVRARFNYSMKLGRPPHYIDKTADGFDAYSAYNVLGYNYLAASFDGGGWQPSGKGYAADVRIMAGNVTQALDKDPDCLNGRIIFQKDGYSMSGESPVVDALPLQLEALKRHGYEVVTVSALMELSPFSDIGRDHPSFAAAEKLLHAGHPVVYRDNTVQTERRLVWQEMAAMMSPWPGTPFRPGNPYAQAVASFKQRYPDCKTEGFRDTGIVTWNDLKALFSELHGVDHDGPVSRGEALIYLEPILIQNSRVS